MSDKPFSYDDSIIRSLKNFCRAIIEVREENAKPTCPECAGSGMTDSYVKGLKPDCERCGGTGRVSRLETYADGTAKRDYPPCPQCQKGVSE